MDKADGHRWTLTKVAKADGPRWSRSRVNALGQSIQSERPSPVEGYALVSAQGYDEQGRLRYSGQAWSKNPQAGGADGLAESELSGMVGPMQRYVYDPRSGELLLSGADIDGDGKLTPGTQDVLSSSQTRYEKAGNVAEFAKNSDSETQAGEWYLVTRSWNYPPERKGERRLVSESRRRVTGLGVKPSNVAEFAKNSEANARPLTEAEKTALKDSILVGESTSATPTVADKVLTSISRNYLNRETGHSFAFSTSPAGVKNLSISQSGETKAVYQAAPDDKAPRLVVSYEYDAFSRPVAVIDPRTGPSRTEYDPQTGQTIAQIDAAKNRTSYEYYPDGDRNAGQLKQVTNALGKWQRYYYSPRGEQIATRGQTDYPVAYDYNEYGERVGLRTFRTEPQGDMAFPPVEGDKTQWTYDEATGVLLKKTYADGQGPDYKYNKAGQLIERLWARKDEKGNRLSTKYEYDEVTGALIGAFYSDGTKITYEYDEANRLKKVNDVTGSREFTYNPKGQVLSETVTAKTHEGTPPLRYQIKRSYYDEFCVQCAGGGTPDQPKQVSLVGFDGLDLNHQVNYEWDSHGNLAKVASPAGVFQYAYDEQSPALLKRIHGPAHKVEYQYEPDRNLITSVKNMKAHNQGVISSYGYENDKLGRRTQITQRGEAFEMLKLYGQNTVQVAYNDRSEVTGYEIRKLGDVGAPGKSGLSQTYAYDPIGNRTQFLTEGGGEKTAFGYQSNALNQYTHVEENQEPAEKATHDPDGNLLDDRRNRCTWNAENRLVKVEAKDGSATNEYTYDYLGRRTTKKQHTKNESPITTFYLYDDWNLFAEIEEKPRNEKDEKPEGEASSIQSKASSLKRANSVRTYTWGRDLSGTVQGAAGVGGLLAVRHKEGEKEQDSVVFPCFDANGNTSQMISPKAQIVAAYQYDAFGRTIDTSGARAAENPWCFSTKPLEPTTGWYCYGYREYNPETGRWASRDPAEERGGENLYGFVAENPINLTDVLGLFEIYIHVNPWPGHVGIKDQHGVTWDYGRYLGPYRNGTNITDRLYRKVNPAAPGPNILRQGQTNTGDPKYRVYHFAVCAEFEKRIDNILKKYWASGVNPLPASVKGRFTVPGGVRAMEPYERYMGSDWNLDSNNCTSFSISQVVEDAAREIKADRKSTELERGQAAVVLRFASHCVSPQGTINVLDGITSENDWISVNGQPSNNEKNEKNEGCCRDSSSK